MIFMISYDLRKAGKDYENVFNGIKEASNGIWCHYLDSTWFIRSNYTSAEEVFAKLKPYLDADDKCLVFEVRKNYNGRMLEKEWNYIKDHIFG